MSFQQKGKVISLPPDPPRVNNDNNNYICIKYCPKGLDHLTIDLGTAEIEQKRCYRW